MKGYKAFSKGLICKDKQYSENTEFVEDKADMCNSGMHFCKEPFDVLNYYPLIDNNGDFTEFAEVEAPDEEVIEKEDKCVTTHLKIGEKLNFAEFIKLVVDAVICKAKVKRVKDSAKIGSSGNSAKIGSSGDFAVICCAGNGSIAKAKKCSWITLAEWQYDTKKNRNIPVCVKTEYVDGDRIKADTWYGIENGEFYEVRNEQEHIK